MQCQSCGSIIKQGMKLCPACGDEVTSAFTASLPRQASSTGLVDYSSIVNTTNSDIQSSSQNSNQSNSQNNSPSNGLSNSSSLENPLNGKQPEAASAAKPIAPAVAPPIMSAVGRDREFQGAAEQKRDVVPSPADLSRTGGGNCRRCQRDLKVGAKFCSICGTSVEPTALDRALSWSRSFFESLFRSSRSAFTGIGFPLPVLIPLVIAGIFVLAAIVQYLLPVEVDAGSYAPVIYHLRSIEYLLVALIFVVASLVFNRR
jgi:RNA polymerase subunit RPABC4/transcription elongation factor Spt4